MMKFGYSGQLIGAAKYPVLIFPPASSVIGGDMILTCHGSDLDCFEDGCQYEAEKPGGLPKNPFLVVTDTYGHLWYAAPSKARGWWLIQNEDRVVVVAFRQDE
ncbi:hypothetical protein ACJQTL_003713 [Escherichia coli]